MTAPRIAPVGLVIALLVGVGQAVSAADDASRVRGKAAGRHGEEQPPPCRHRLRTPAAPPARSMPELFSRLGEGFARDPARGFQGVLDELARLEGPALEGITLSAAEERLVGRRAREEFLARAAAQGYRVVDDPARLSYLRDLVAVLSRRMKHRERYPAIEVTLIDSPVADGQSFPGGFLVFTTALLEEPDEATVAGVVAHELAHLDLGHLYGYARRSKLAEASYAGPPGPAGGPDRSFTRQVALFGLLMNPYRPEHETQADCAAVTWMFQEGYDPRALVRFFERLHARDRDEPEAPFWSFGRTHPYSLERRRHVLERLAQLRRWRPSAALGLYPENLRRRSARGLEPEAG